MKPLQTLLNLCGLASRQQLSEALEREARAEVALDRLNGLVLSLSAKCATKSAEIEFLRQEPFRNATLKNGIAGTFLRGVTEGLRKPESAAERQMTEAALERLTWSLKGVPSNEELQAWMEAAE